MLPPYGLTKTKLLQETIPFKGPEDNHLCKACPMGSFRLHVCEVFVKLPELLHGGSEGHDLTAGIQTTLRLPHLHDDWRSLCRKDDVVMSNELLHG